MSASITTNNVNLKQPKGLYLLFFAEMWERFSYYGMRAILVLFMTKELLFSDTLSFMVYGAFTAFVYMTPVFGGMIADKLLGFTKAIKLGSVLIILGHISLALPDLDALPDHAFFYIGLSFIIVGTGFFKANVSSMVGHLYEKNDPRRDSGFTIFYMGINLGAFLASISVAIVAQWLGWHYGFGLAAIGMLLGLLTFIYADYKNVFSPDSNKPNLSALTKKLVLGINVNASIYIVSILLVPLFAWLLANPGGSRLMLVIVGMGIVLYFLYQAMTSKKDERNHIFAILILSFFSMFFWSFFEQAGSSINLFTDRNIDRLLFNYEFPAGSFQALNSFFIITLAPFFASLWIRLSKINKDPSVPIKFVLGIFFVGVGFMALAIAAYNAIYFGKVSMLWVMLAYFFHTVGELCLSPIGLSIVTKLAPVRLVGMMMGAWFLSSAFANYIASIIATLTSTPEGLEDVVLSAKDYAATYFDVFLKIGVTAFIASLILLALTPAIKKLMR